MRTRSRQFHVESLESRNLLNGASLSSAVSLVVTPPKFPLPPSPAITFQSQTATLTSTPAAFGKTDVTAELDNTLDALVGPNSTVAESVTDTIIITEDNAGQITEHVSTDLLIVS